MSQLKFMCGCFSWGVYLRVSSFTVPKYFNLQICRTLLKSCKALFVSSESYPAFRCVGEP